MSNIRHISLYVILLVPLAITASCATTQSSSEPETSISYSLQISLRIDSIANDSWIYFQNGKQINKLSLNQWGTYCRMHVHNKDKNADYPATVTPGMLIASGVTQRTESSRNGSSSGYYRYQLKLVISSAARQDVESLICERQTKSLGDFYPTLADIRQTLGVLIDVSLLSISSDR